MAGLQRPNFGGISDSDSENENYNETSRAERRKSSNDMTSWRGLMARAMQGTDESGTESSASEYESVYETEYEDQVVERKEAYEEEVDASSVASASTRRGGRGRESSVSTVESDTSLSDFSRLPAQSRYPHSARAAKRHSMPTDYRHLRNKNTGDSRHKNEKAGGAAGGAAAGKALEPVDEDASQLHLTAPFTQSEHSQHSQASSQYPSDQENVPPAGVAAQSQPRLDPLPEADVESLSQSHGVLEDVSFFSVGDAPQGDAQNPSPMPNRKLSFSARSRHGSMISPSPPSILRANASSAGPARKTPLNATAAVAGLSSMVRRVGARTRRPVVQVSTQMPEVAAPASAPVVHSVSIPESIPVSVPEPVAASPANALGAVEQLTQLVKGLKKTYLPPTPAPDQPRPDGSFVEAGSGSGSEEEEEEEEPKKAPKKAARGRGKGDTRKQNPRTARKSRARSGKEQEEEEEEEEEEEGVEEVLPSARKRRSARIAAQKQDEEPQESESESMTVRRRKSQRKKSSIRAKGKAKTQKKGRLKRARSRRESPRKSTPRESESEEEIHSEEEEQKAAEEERPTRRRSESVPEPMELSPQPPESETHPAYSPLGAMSPLHIHNHSVAPIAPMTPMDVSFAGGDDFEEGHGSAPVNEMPALEPPPVEEEAEHSSSPQRITRSKRRKLKSRKGSVISEPEDMLIPSEEDIESPMTVSTSARNRKRVSSSGVGQGKKGRGKARSGKSTDATKKKGKRSDAKHKSAKQKRRTKKSKKEVSPSDKKARRKRKKADSEMDEPIKKRARVAEDILILPEPTPEDPGVRRSKRVRFKPLRFWANETIEHTREVLTVDKLERVGADKLVNPNGAVDYCDLFEQRTTRPRPRRRGKGEGKGKSKKGRGKGKRGQEKEEESVEATLSSDGESDADMEEASVFNGVAAVFDSQQENVKDVLIAKLFSMVHMVDLQAHVPGAGNEFVPADRRVRGGKALEMDQFSAGFLELPPGATKQPEIIAMTEIFFVISGARRCLLLEICSHEKRLSKNAVFFVPPDNEYSLTNLSKTHAVKLFFVLVKRGDEDLLSQSHFRASMASVASVGSMA